MVQRLVRRVALRRVQHQQLVQQAGPLGPPGRRPARRDGLRGRSPWVKKKGPKKKEEQRGGGKATTDRKSCSTRRGRSRKKSRCASPSPCVVVVVVVVGAGGGWKVGGVPHTSKMRFIWSSSSRPWKSVFSKKSSAMRQLCWWWAVERLSTHMEKGGSRPRTRWTTCRRPWCSWRRP